MKIFRLHLSIPTFLVLLQSSALLAQVADSIQFRIVNQEVYGPELKNEATNFFCVDTLYTWTSGVQIEELRAGKALLNRSKSPTKGYSEFDVALRDTYNKKDTLIQLLLEERFANKRFAWTNGWATLLGWKGETYGEHLIQIVLKPESIIGSMDCTSGCPLQFFDRNGKALSKEYVLANSDRIAGVYHVNEGISKRTIWKRKRGGTYARESKCKHYAKDYVPFREFVLVNEKMIASWSYGTPEIKSEIAREVHFLSQFVDMKDCNLKAHSSILDCWYYPNYAQMSAQNYFDFSKCIENDYYLFNRKRISKIISELEGVLAKQSSEIRR